MENKKLWGGRFSNKLVNTDLEKLNSSINIDKRLYAEDLIGSRAYSKCLRGAKLLTEEEVNLISEGLNTIKLEWENKTFIIKDGDEDIHTANERRLKELIGEPANKLHVGRSRNDQVATDMKLWLRSSLDVIATSLKALIEIISLRASNEIDILMPGYTHLQRAQPVRWSHWLLSHGWSLKADVDRLEDILKHLNVLPLGSGAIAGNPFNIDRNLLAFILDFNSVTPNSMQAVADRDFIAEFLFWASLVGVHLSKLAEDLIIFSTKEFNFVTIDESFSTGSSLMPQKRNPDSLELIRGVGGSLFGQCCSFMMVLKSLPSTYNKDLQTDKELMFGTFDKLASIVDVAIGTIDTLKIHGDKCREALSYDMLATDLAYYLVKKNVAFREAHHLAGRVIVEAEKQGVFIHDLTLEELKSVSGHFEADVAKIWNYENSVEQYQAIGGTSKENVTNQVELIKCWLAKAKKP